MQTSVVISVIYNIDIGQDVMQILVTEKSNMKLLTGIENSNQVW